MQVSHFRICDSRNMNLSPFCNVSSLSDPVKWALDVRNLYETTNMPDYVETLVSPFRSNYDTDKRRQNELLTTLTEVLLGLRDCELSFSSLQSKDKFQLSKFKKLLKSYINKTKLTTLFSTLHV